MTSGLTPGVMPAFNPAMTSVPASTVETSTPKAMAIQSDFIPGCVE